MSKYTEKIIGRKVYKIRDTSNDICIYCLGHGFTMSLSRMSNHFETHSFKLSCSHCEKGKKMRLQEQQMSVKEIDND